MSYFNYVFISDFAKDLRIPKFMVPPASLRIYRNSTARYATQWVLTLTFPNKIGNYFNTIYPGITTMWPVLWTSESTPTIHKYAKLNMRVVSILYLFNSQSYSGNYSFVFYISHIFCFLFEWQQQTFDVSKISWADVFDNCFIIRK